MYRKLFLFFLIGFIFQTISSQVGINTENPNSLTALDVNVLNNNGEIVPKGIMVPRMSKTQRDGMDITNPDNANSLLIYNTTEDCFNYFSKTKNSWLSLCGSTESEDAVFTVDCSQSSVKGNYMVNILLSTSNYIALTVTVTQAGKYNISGYPEDDNGYYFSAIGEFVKPGAYTLRIPGYGTPVNSNESGDELIVLNNNEIICNNLLVKINAAKYTLDCSSIVVSGNYIATVPLTSENTIQIKLTADVSLAGYAYDASTEIVNGYSFSASGTLVAGEQTITLTGSGTPITNGSDTFILKNNTTNEEVQSCLATVNVSARPVRILSVSSSSTYYSIGNSANYDNKALLNSDYFSLTSGATYSNSGFVFGSITSNNRLAAGISSFNPDIVIAQYAYIPNTNEITVLTNFVNNGGVFIYCTDYSSNANVLSLIQSIFDNNTTIQLGADEGNGTDVVTLEDNGTTIVNGPFKDLTGLGMARDAGHNFGLVASSLPTDETTVIAYSNSGASVRMLAHKTKGFVFIGDGGPFAAYTSSTPYTYPAKFAESSGKVTAIVDSASSPASYNSFLFLNTIAWAIDYIKQSGQYPK